MKRHDHIELFGFSHICAKDNSDALTESIIPPVLHHTTQPLDNTTRLHGSFLRLCLLTELAQSHRGNLVTAELRQQLLLSRKIEILVRLDLFLEKGNSKEYSE